MLKYTIVSPRLGTIAGFRFKGDLFAYLNAEHEEGQGPADDWQIEVFGNSVGTYAMLKAMTQVQLNEAFDG